MMKLLTNYSLCFVLIFTLLAPKTAKADMDPRVKALGTMALYGTVGGALLGTASLAFGAKGRSVAIGASLGLYAGLIFGTYVVASHQMKKYNQYDTPYYPDSGDTPYAPTGGEGGVYEDNSYGSSYLWNPYEMPEMKIDQDRLNRGLKLSQDFKNVNEPVYYLQLLRFQF